MNTYTQKQTDNALRILAEIFEEDQKFKDLPPASKETFALCMLEAFKIKPTQE